MSRDTHQSSSRGTELRAPRPRRRRAVFFASARGGSEQGSRRRPGRRARRRRRAPGARPTPPRRRCLQLLQSSSSCAPRDRHGVTRVQEEALEHLAHPSMRALGTPGSTATSAGEAGARSCLPSVCALHQRTPRLRPRELVLERRGLTPRPSMRIVLARHSSVNSPKRTASRRAADSSAPDLALVPATAARGTARGNRRRRFVRAANDRGRALKGRHPGRTSPPRAASIARGTPSPPAGCAFGARATAERADAQSPVNAHRAEVVLPKRASVSVLRRARATARRRRAHSEARAFARCGASRRHAAPPRGGATRRDARGGRPASARGVGEEALAPGRPRRLERARGRRRRRRAWQALHAPPTCTDAAPRARRGRRSPTRPWSSAVTSGGLRNAWLVDAPTSAPPAIAERKARGRGRRARQWEEDVLQARGSARGSPTGAAWAMRWRARTR